MTVIALQVASNNEVSLLTHTELETVATNTTQLSVLLTEPASAASVLVSSPAFLYTEAANIINRSRKAVGWEVAAANRCEDRVTLDTTLSMSILNRVTRPSRGTSPIDTLRAEISWAQKKSIRVTIVTQSFIACRLRGYIPCASPWSYSTLHMNHQRDDITVPTNISINALLITQILKNSAHFGIWIFIPSVANLIPCRNVPRAI
ncbi:hypothetical protein BDU57DRAFT_522523 [Ampelomyces quisqualis]|uniref:Uncharacterized protein n=1 Tax=Ampelomyces quisqualis TaxID=50730 RepID=A0A6A5QA21_AMPQU|nr:hypothetical protein BDU57DRAFT_522523 [Ampelomyces quisqualis]